MVFLLTMIIQERLMDLLLRVFIAMATATHIKKNIQLGWFIYRFSCLVHYHHSRERGGMQAVTVLEEWLRVLQATGSGLRHCTES